MINEIKSRIPLVIYKFQNVKSFANFPMLVIITFLNTILYLRNQNFLFVGQAITLDNFLQEFANSDRATMLSLAMNLGSESQSQYSWILNLWPPGSALLNYFLLIFTSNIYIIQWSWGLIIFSLWMLVSHKIIQISCPSYRLLTIVVLFLTLNNPIFLFKFYTSSMLMSDSIATPVGIGAILYLYSGFKKNSIKEIMSFAFLIACAAHFRAIWMKEIEFIFLVSSFLLLLKKRRKLLINPKKRNREDALRKIVLGGATAYLLTIPYRLIQVTQGKSFFKWGMDDSQIWASAWINTVGPNSWLANSGINPACYLDFIQCQTFSVQNPDMTILSSTAKDVFFDNPINWILYRAKFVFFGMLSNYDIEMPNLYISIFGICIAIAYLISLLIILHEVTRKNLGASIFMVPFLADFASMMYFHVENRYFLPSIMTSIFTIIIFGPKFITRANKVKENL